MSPKALRSEIWLPRPLEEVFDFFADARNLQALTPDWLDFSVLTPAPILMRAGTLIDYRLRLRGFPIRWQSEITAWEPPHRFVDEQRRGPYKLWIHEHRFEARDGGTLVGDFVRYAAPGGWLVEWLFVRRDVERIFQFRREKLLALFDKRC
ncbi:MAG: SRPBCC family protein [Verrucomicrobiota bacterium]|jgi:ligand-binding SRPBCC domain-containing protein